MDPDDLLPGDLLNHRYCVHSELSHGGFGRVYLAHDRQLHNRPVVIKTLIHRVHRNQNWVERKFRQESEALSRIDHPGVVGVFDQGETPRNQRFIVMQFVDGPTLRAVLKKGPLPIARLARLTWEIAGALTAAHDKQVIHRDLKPENIMLRSLPGGREMAVIVDFGIAGVHASEHDTESESLIVGTPAYMAPEHQHGNPVAASDIYGLGLIVYECLTGRRPLTPSSPDYYLRPPAERIVNPRQHRPDLPDAAANAIVRALELNPADRHPRAIDFAEEFVQGLQLGPGTAREEIARLLDSLTANPLDRTLRKMMGGYTAPLNDYLCSGTLSGGSTFENTVKLPDKFIEKVVIANGSHATTVTVGNSTWIKSGFNSPQTDRMGLRNMPAQESRSAIPHDNELLVMLADLSRPGTNIQSVGPAEFRGKQAEAVAISNRETGLHAKLYVDPHTHLLLGRTIWPRRPGTVGSRDQEYADYRDVDGWILPFQITTFQEGKPSAQTIVSSMQINTGVSDDVFEALLVQYRAEAEANRKAEAAFKTAVPLFQQKKFQEAIKACDEALASKPDFDDAFQLRADCYTALRNFPRALIDVMQLINVRPDLGAFYRRGCLYQNMGMHPGAIADFARVIQLKPDWPDAYWNRGKSYSDTRRYQEAGADFTEAIRLKPGYADAYAHRGLNHHRADQHPQAIDDFTAAIRLMPHYLNAYLYRGRSYLKVLQWENALADFTQVVQLNPNHPEAYALRAMVYANLKRDPQALSDLNEAIRLTPANSGAYALRGAIKQRMGDAQGAAQDKAEAARLVT